MSNTISIIISNKNDGKHLLRQLNSIVYQTVPPDEIFLIDDGSTDNSKEVIEEFQEKDSNKLSIVTKFYKTSKGYNIRVTEALKETECKYVFMGSSNDYLLPGFIQSMHRGMMYNFKLISACDGFNMKEGPYEGRSLLRSGYYIPGHCSCIDTKCALELTGLRQEIKWHSDWILMQSACLKYGCYCIPFQLSVLTTDGNKYGLGAEGPEQKEVVKNMVKMVTTEEAFADIKDELLQHIIAKVPHAKEIIHGN